MKLFEIAARDTVDPQFAWLEPEVGPENIRGVRLAYIDPIKKRFEHNIALAQQDDDLDRVKRLSKQHEFYQQKGQKFFTPDLGWWMSEEDFHQGKEGFNRKSKQHIFAQFPNLEIFPSRKEAEKAAEEAGEI